MHEDITRTQQFHFWYAHRWGKDLQLLARWNGAHLEHQGKFYSSECYLLRNLESLI